MVGFLFFLQQNGCGCAELWAVALVKETIMFEKTLRYGEVFLSIILMLFVNRIEERKGHVKQRHMLPFLSYFFFLLPSGRLAFKDK